MLVEQQQHRTEELQREQEQAVAIETRTVQVGYATIQIMGLFW